MASTDRASLRDALEFGHDILPIGLPYGKLHPEDDLSVENESPGPSASRRDALSAKNESPWPSASRRDALSVDAPSMANGRHTVHRIQRQIPLAIQHILHETICADDVLPDYQYIYILWEFALCYMKTLRSPLAKKIFLWQNGFD